MINAVEVVNCSGCYGRGLVFIGDNEDYYVEPCECVKSDELL